MEKLTPDEANRLKTLIQALFTPAVPVGEKELFSGRIDQINRVIDAANSPGRHAIIFGERGVGKSSLANVLHAYLQAQRENIPLINPRIICNRDDDYASIWERVFTNMLAQLEESADDISFPENPGDVVRLLAKYSKNNRLVIILDEFDRVSRENLNSKMADTIKALSDQNVDTTIVVVGVGDNVEEIIAGHQSIERSLCQILLPRMAPDELLGIITNRLPKIDMSISAEATTRIVVLSQGLPFYTHLLTLHAGKIAIGDLRKEIVIDDVIKAIPNAIQDALQSISGTYHRVTATPRKDTLFKEVLLACALANPDDLGFFSAGDIRDPLNMITGKKYEIPSFSKHLNDFSSDERRSVLQKQGSPRNYRYRFINPLLRPYIVLNGLAKKLIDESQLQ